MFDDLKKEPEDIFENTDDQPAPPAPQPAALPTPPPILSAAPPAPQIRVNEPIPVDKPSHWKLLVVILGAVLVIAIAAALAYYLLAGRGSQVPVAPDEAAEQESKASAPEVEKAPESTQPVVIPAPVIEPDSDQDGLSDAEEAAIGTSISSADTDQDGLFDREEVEVYKTNPLRADTDGDSYLDGAEVSNGYNPNGSGKLFEVPVSE